jgi:hypothetical protein
LKALQKFYDIELTYTSNAIEGNTVRPVDRPSYLASLETASLTQNLEPFFSLMSHRLEETLSDYVQVLQESL